MGMRMAKWKALLATSSFHVRSAIEGTGLYLYLYFYCECLMRMEGL